MIEKREREKDKQYCGISNWNQSINQLVSHCITLPLSLTVSSVVICLFFFVLIWYIFFLQIDTFTCVCVYYRYQSLLWLYVHNVQHVCGAATICICRSHVSSWSSSSCLYWNWISISSLCLVSDNVWCLPM